jgi:hypothetical protein
LEISTGIAQPGVIIAAAGSYSQPNGCHGGIVMAADNDHPKKGWLKIFNSLPTILMLPSGKRLHNYGKSPCY